MLQVSEDTVRRDVEELLKNIGSGGRIGLCCINMDYGTPDANIHVVLQAAARA